MSQEHSAQDITMIIDLRHLRGVFSPLYAVRDNTVENFEDFSNLQTFKVHIEFEETLY